MKNSLKYLKAIAICFTFIFVSSCTNEIDGTSEYPFVPDSKIKKLSFIASWGTESWEFTYDDNDRVTSIANSWEGGAPDMITYDYSQAGKLTITKGGYDTNYTLDSEGRVSKELWNSSGTEYAEFKYDEVTGILSKIIEYYGGEDHLKYENIINNGNITNRIRYYDDGVTIREDRVFEYTIANNPSGIQQVFTVDSQWKNTGGLFGSPTKKLAKNYVRKVDSDPDSRYGATFDYTFDEQNRVATLTKNGTSSGGSFSESWSYTYYED
ncbi:hypothetical protein [Mariniflexile sp.]|uniref:hypothetical protein n=1 Tax=Mariniflexile sp. TaxID=1979402 RepID=UPI004048DC8D